MFSVHKVGCYLLHVEDKSFFVSAFELTYAFGNIPTCSIDIVQKGKTIYTQQPAVKSIGVPLQLIQKTSSIQSQLLPCKLVQYKDQADDKGAVLFDGYLCSVNTYVVTGTKLQIGVTCTCLAPACALMYAVHSDFVYTPSSVAMDTQLLKLWGVDDISKLRGDLFAQTMNITDLVSSSDVNTAKDDIATMIKKLFDVWNNYKKQKELQPDFVQPKLDISEYFDSQYVLSKFAQSLTDAKDSAFLRSLSQSLVKGLLTNTVYQSVLFAAGQKMLTISPKGLGQKKLSIVPNIVLPYEQGNQISRHMITSFTVGVDTLRHLRTPNVLYVDMAKANLWMSGEDKNNRGIYGRYPSNDADIPQVAKVKIVKSPSWLLHWAIQAAVRGQSTQRSKLQNIPQDQSDSAPPAGQTAMDIFREQQNLKKLRDAYAKAVYFNTYLKDKQADMQFVVNNVTLNYPVKLLGKSVLIQSPVTLKQAKGPKDEMSQFYGRMVSVTYTYTAATDRDSASSLRIRCHVDGVTPSDDSKYASFYTDAQNIINNLYVKKS